jgi:HD-like signal output (HDOD) protein
MESMKTAEQVIEGIGDLPAMPSIVSQVLHLMEDPLADMNAVCAVLQNDPALAAKILRISNSSYYGMKRYVGTLKLALVVLGVREVRNIVLGVTVFDTYGRGRLDTAFPLELWEHSVRVGGLCKRLGIRLNLALQGEDFIAGLLHDIGKMVLWRQDRDAYDDLYFRLKHRRAAFLDAETVTFGFDHCDAAAALASAWNLPIALRDALWLHHPRNASQQLRDAKDPMLAALVRIANDAARRHASDAPRDEPGGEDREAWDILDQAPTPIPRGEREQIIRDYIEETAQVPVPAL